MRPASATGPSQRRYAGPSPTEMALARSVTAARPSTSSSVTESPSLEPAPWRRRSSSPYDSSMPLARDGRAHPDAAKARTAWRDAAHQTEHQRWQSSGHAPARVSLRAERLVPGRVLSAAPFPPKSRSGRLRRLRTLPPKGTSAPTTPIARAARKTFGRSSRRCRPAAHVRDVVCPPTPRSCSQRRA